MASGNEHETQQCIKLGSGCLLIEEGWFVRALGGTMTDRQFRSWMTKCCGVAALRLGKKWFYEQAAVELAVTELTMSKREAYAPGCDKVAKGAEVVTMLHEDLRAKRSSEVEAELLRRKKMHTQMLAENTRKAVRNAAERVRTASTRKSAAQEQ